MPTLLVPLLALLLSPRTPPGDAATLDRILAAGREGSRVMEHLDYLSNRFGPRLTGSDNLQNACEWARDRFRELGLESARLEPWGEIAVGFNRGPAWGRMVRPEERWLHFGTNAWTAGTKGVVRGRALLAPESEEELEHLRPGLRGAWILEPRAQASREARDFRDQMRAACDEALIAGLIRPSRGERIVFSGRHRITWEELPERPEITLLEAEWEEIAARIRAGEEVELEFDIRNHFKKGPVPQSNVVADLVGSERPDEVVIVGGHIDSWDGATGATDNATGCATTIEAARILIEAGAKPRRTIRFMLWSGEEQGLLGSRAYVRSHPELVERISAVFVHDEGTNPISGILATRALLEDFETVFAPVVALDPSYPFQIREVPGLRGAGSDHAPFLAAGVPAFFWRQKGRADYSRTHHTQFDTYDAVIPEYLEHSAIVVALAAWGIAELDHLLSREGLVEERSRLGSRRRMGVVLDGMEVQEVVPDSLAAKAGVHPGDIIRKVDGLPVDDPADLARILQEGESKKTITLSREGAEIDLVFDWGG